MIYDKEAKIIELSEVSAHAKEEFGLTGVAGRDAIAAQIEADIDEYCQQAFDDGPRSHLGASQIGNECERALWFAFRWMYRERFSGRMQRLFNRGHLEEERIISWLRGIGFDVQQVDVDGKQVHVVDCNGHFGGSSDGSAFLPTRYVNDKDLSSYKLLLEFKTANQKSFELIQGSGFQKAKPGYWTQTCTYGAKLKLQYCLFLCVNKNTDDIDIEVVELDLDLGNAQIAKAEKIIFAILPPPRISEDASFWKCKSMCGMNGICHLGEPVAKNCRSCQGATPIAEAQWFCSFYQQNIPKEFIAKGCDAWSPLPR